MQEGQHGCGYKADPIRGSRNLALAACENKRPRPFAGAVKLAIIAGFPYRRRHSSRSGTDSALVSLTGIMVHPALNPAGSPVQN
jgi:hypothetical protein